MNRIIRSSQLLRSPLSLHFASIPINSRNLRRIGMSTATPLPSSGKPRYIEIGINLTDPVYNGSYHGTQRHQDDLSDVIQRAVDSGCSKLIVTGSDLTESHKAVELARKYPGVIYGTVGVHPCSCGKITDEKYLADVKELALSAKEAGYCVAYGEIGLDYDRLTLCSKDLQLEYFAKQLDIAIDIELPLFLHSRAAATDFAQILRERLDRLPKRGVVHSFTGTEAEMLELVEMGFHIGINGCSMKTEENIAVIRKIPLERIQLETDGPWCEMRASHASAQFVKGMEEQWKSVKKEKWIAGAMVKGRNEPCMIGKVAKAVAGIRGEDVTVLTEAAWANSLKMFGLGLT